MMRALIAGTSLLGLICLLDSPSAGQPKDPTELIPPPIDPTEPPGPPVKATPKAKPSTLPSTQPRVTKKAAKAAQAQPAAPVVITVAGGWTDSDTEQAAKALVKDLQRSGALTRFKARRGRPPVIMLQPVANRTTRHIDLRTFDEALRKLLAGSPKLKLAARSVGPDLVISGRLHEMDDTSGGTTLQSFMLGLSLLHVETTEKLWLGVHRARKLVESSLTKQGSQVKVSRRKLDETIDLSGRFNDSDATAVANAAAKDVLGSALARRRPPHIVRFHPLGNRTSEHIDTRLILAQLESLLLRSGKVRVVASREEAQNVRDARAEAARTASDATLPAAGHELTSTCVVTGRITSTSAAGADSTTTLYVVAFEAVDADDSSKLWVMSKAINKIVRRPSGGEW